MSYPFTAHDLAQLAAHGLTPAEANRHLELTADPPKPVRLLRSCRVGDGIVALGEEGQGRAVERAEAAARDGRLSKFVPASGAATRMFAAPMEMLAILAETDAEGQPSHESPTDRERIEALATAGRRSAADVCRLFAELDRLAFHDRLAKAAAATGHRLGELVESGEWGLALALLLGPAPGTYPTEHPISRAALGYEHLPKGLIPFHRHPGGVRTPFDEHLFEAAALIADRSGLARIHFTVGADQRTEIESILERRRYEIGVATDTRLEITYSVQEPFTDTLAADPAGSPFRLADGSLLFRPGGHGSLLGNLQSIGEEAGGELVLVKNIDNVSPEHHAELERHWKKVLAGLAVELRDEVDRLLARLDETGDVPADAVGFAERWFGFQAPPGASGEQSASALRDRFDRPLRICGMVENRGEPGGGPFWAEGSFGPAPQIVEKAQIDSEDPQQAAILASATHFNPVDMVCSLVDRHGQPYELARFVDPKTAFVSHKRAEGREVLALERPGLWNGAMAGWNTIFVEVPGETFTPVKTVMDLLRPEHQPGD